MDNIIANSVKECLDDKAGIIVSGGVDSTLIASYVQRLDKIMERKN